MLRRHYKLYHQVSYKAGVQGTRVLGIREQWRNQLKVEQRRTNKRKVEDYPLFLQSPDDQSFGDEEEDYDGQMLQEEESSGNKFLVEYDSEADCEGDDWDIEIENEVDCGESLDSEEHFDEDPQEEEDEETQETDFPFSLEEKMEFSKEATRFDRQESCHYFECELSKLGGGGREMVADTFYKGTGIPSESLEDDNVEICLQMALLVHSLTT